MLNMSHTYNTTRRTLPIFDKVASGQYAGSIEYAIHPCQRRNKYSRWLRVDRSLLSYHDWVASEGYFSDRDREVPPGCEEIDATERERREAASLDAMSEYFAEPHPDEQETHPSLRDDAE